MDPNLGPLLATVLAGSALEGSLVVWWLPTFSLTRHPGFYSASVNSLVWVIGSGPQAVQHFLALLASVCLPYAIALGVAGRLRGHASLFVAFAGSFIFGVTMLLLFPAGANDIFHNIVDGRDLWLRGLNPMLTAPSTVTGDPFVRYVMGWEHEPAGYGPLWYLLTAPAVFLGGTGRDGNILAFKALPLVFELVSLGAIVGIMHRLDRERLVLSVVCFGWNPLVLWEVAGNGHNDIIMMAFALLSLLVLLSTRWPLAFSLLSASVLVKYVSVVLFPVFVVWILKRYGSSASWPLIAGLLGAMVTVAAIFRPLWAGPAVFRGLLLPSKGFTFSPGLALLRLRGIELPQGFTGLMVGNSLDVLEVKAGLALTFLMLSGLVLLLVRPTPAGLLDACITEFFLCLTLVVWWFWPWYLIWALALAALRPGTALNRLIVLFSFTALFTYIVTISGAGAGLFGRMPLQVSGPLLVFLAPSVYAAVHVWSPRALAVHLKQVVGARFALAELSQPISPRSD